jgi:hypothetical protein
VAEQPALGGDGAMLHLDQTAEQTEHPDDDEAWHKHGTPPVDKDQRKSGFVDNHDYQQIPKLTPVCQLRSGDVKRIMCHTGMCAKEEINPMAGDFSSFCPRQDVRCIMAGRCIAGANQAEATSHGMVGRIRAIVRSFADLAPGALGDDHDQPRPA